MAGWGLVSSETAEPFLLLDGGNGDDQTSALVWGDGDD